MLKLMPKLMLTLMTVPRLTLLVSANADDNECANADAKA